MEELNYVHVTIPHLDIEDREAYKVEKGDRIRIWWNDDGRVERRKPNIDAPSEDVILRFKTKGL